MTNVSTGYSHCAEWRMYDGGIFVGQGHTHSYVVTLVSLTLSQITYLMSLLSPLKEFYTTTNLRLANMRVFPPSLYDPDGSCPTCPALTDILRSKGELK